MADFAEIINWMTGAGVVGLGVDWVLKRGERRSANRKNMLEEVDKLWTRIDAVEAEAETERNKRREIEDLMDDQAKQIQQLQAVTLQRDQAIRERDAAIRERDEAIAARSTDAGRIAELEQRVVDLEALVRQLQAQLDETTRERDLGLQILDNLPEGCDPSD